MENPERQYTIQRGDNLIKIVKKFNPNLSQRGVMAACREIQKANVNTIHDINKIRAGDSIFIPESLKSGIKEETRAGLTNIRKTIEGNPKATPKAPPVEIRIRSNPRPTEPEQREIPKGMPSTEEAMALFFSENFKKGKLPREIARMGKRQDAYAQAYRELGNAAKNIQGRGKEWLKRFVKLIPEGTDLETRAPICQNSGNISMPLRNDLQHAHEDALDLFFTHVEKTGDREIGPELCTVSGGIVIAARGDWQGGRSEKSYRKGGLSPKAGNGVIIYNPKSQEHFYYAHMSQVDVKTGNVVEAGQIIGRGGNTGTKAMQPGRGGHVHFEIHEVNPVTGNTVAKPSRNLYAQIQKDLAIG